LWVVWGPILGGRAWVVGWSAWRRNNSNFTIRRKYGQEHTTGFNTQGAWMAEQNSRHMSHGVRLQCIWRSCHFSFKVKSTCDLAPTPNTHTTRMSCSAERQLYLRLSADGLQEGQIEKIFVCVCVTKGEEALASGRHADSCLPGAAPGVSPRHLPHQHPVWPPRNRSSFRPTQNSPP
jgi:hypothetical protein